MSNRRSHCVFNLTGGFTIKASHRKPVLAVLFTLIVMAIQPSQGLCQPGQLPTVFSTVKKDETVQFFRTAAFYEPEAREWHIPIHAWVYEPETSRIRIAAFRRVLARQYGLALDKTSTEHFNRRVNLLIADNERGKRLVIQIAGKTEVLPKTDPRGHTGGVVRLPAEVVNEYRSGNLLPYSLATRTSDDRTFRGDVLLVPPEGFSVISDIDDTVKITGVTNKKDLMDYTFYRPFAAVPGMAELYQQFPDQHMFVHFVSSSPWQLYSPLDTFLQDTGFPPASFSLKTVRFRDRNLLNLFKSGEVTKPIAIEGLLEKYPQRQFILIGDSGEQDPEVYHLIAKNHTRQILAVFIRDVTGQEILDERYAGVLADLGPDKFFVFDDPLEVRAVLKHMNLPGAETPSGEPRS